MIIIIIIFLLIHLELNHFPGKTITKLILFSWMSLGCDNDYEMGRPESNTHLSTSGSNDYHVMMTNNQSESSSERLRVHTIDWQTSVLEGGKK